MENVINVFMERDGMSESDAKAYLNDVMLDVEWALEYGTHDEVEDTWMGATGLEIDYLLDVLSGLSTISRAVDRI